MPRLTSSKKRVASKGGSIKATSSVKKPGKRHDIQSLQRKASKPTASKTEARCPDCGAIYFKKHWHTAALLNPEVVKMASEVRRCMECEARAESGSVHPYAGEVVLSGLDDADERSMVLATVYNIGDRAFLRNPEERIVSIATSGNDIVIRTTENQLAMSIGKQVHSSRKGGELQITWSHDDKPVRVRWHAKPHNV